MSQNVVDDRSLAGGGLFAAEIRGVGLTSCRSASLAGAVRTIARGSYWPDCDQWIVALAPQLAANNTD